MSKGKQHSSRQKIQAIGSIVAAVVLLLLPFDFYRLDIIIAIGLIANGIYRWQESGRFER